MNKLRMTLVGLAVAALAAPAYAGGFGVSVRGDVGPTGSQVPYFSVEAVNGTYGYTSSPVVNNYTTYQSNRKNGEWDFSGRIFWYMGCMPCNTYAAASWQGSKHTVTTTHAAVEQNALRTAGEIKFPRIAVDLPNVNGTSDFWVNLPLTAGPILFPEVTVDPLTIGAFALASVDQNWKVTPTISVENKFSKGKLGFGIDLATCCKAFTLTTEFGVNYLSAELNTVKTYALSTAGATVGPFAVGDLEAATQTIPGQTVYIIDSAEWEDPPAEPLAASYTSTGMVQNVTVGAGDVISALQAVAIPAIPGAPVALASGIAEFTYAAGPGFGALTLSSGVGPNGEQTFTWSPSITERERTEGVGLYASLKGEYKFADSCFGNCFSVYAKAEISDIIGKQNYSYLLSVGDTYAAGGETTNTLTDAQAIAIQTPTTLTQNKRETAEVNTFTEHSATRYSNIVEVDLEAAFVYSPCIKCWDNMNMSFAVGFRTDSFVNLFAHHNKANQSILSLTRPTIFLEVGIKV